MLTQNAPNYCSHIQLCIISAVLLVLNGEFKAMYSIETGVLPNNTLLVQTLGNYTLAYSIAS